MVSARTLQPQDQIAHYRIVGPIGAGGMGEVYLAQDQTLERSVALKILPPELVRSEERVRRFVREAKSASSLNHPNIVTIYEIGQDEIHGPEGAASAATGSSSVHYISMELVSGETLTTKIHHDKTDLRTLLGYLAQAAEGLAKAHSAGIVHRDLKPGNIMVSKDGYAKVLDFGLAKLTERQSTDNEVTLAPGEAGDDTNVGAVVGTVGYMAPEQVRGGAVDHRADIFSFGCILYEAATRKKPFAADSNVETMHKILHDKPVPVEELNKDVPAELRRLIRRCLAKSPDQRFQSAKDLAIELREIVDEYDALSPSGSSGSGSSALGAGVAGRRRIPPAALIGGGIALAAAVLAGVLMLGRQGDKGGRAPAAPIRITTVTNRGNSVSCALSPDGRYLAYVQTQGGLGSIRVRQLSTGSDVQILEPQKVVPNGLRFTPNGDYLFYQSADPDREGYTAIFEIPSLGGTPRKRTYDVDSRVTFSPDGKQICFFRGMPQKNMNALVIFNLEDGKERILAGVSPPLSFATEPSWSPDGKRVAIVEARGGVSLGNSVVTYRVDNGKREPVGKNAWVATNDLAWLPDGTGFIVAAMDRSTFTFGQLFLVSYPEGQSRRITSDPDFYFNTNISADGTTIAAVRGHQEANLWIAAPGGVRSVRQVTFGSGEEGFVDGFDTAPDSAIFYATLRAGGAQVWTVNANGTGERVVTSGHTYAREPFYRNGAGIIYQQGDEDLTPHIWRADASGENARQLTTGSGENIGDVSRDGKTLLFQRDDVPDVLWSVSTDGGEPVRLGVSSRNSGLFSPDGARIFHTFIHSINGQGAFSPQIIPAKGGEPAITPALPPRAVDVRWTPDSNGLSYLHASNERRNVLRLPLDGGPVQEITRFTDGRITLHRWSPDGKRLLVRRRTENADNLWITAADGSNAVALTDFETGNISNMRWSKDGSFVAFTYGETSQNVVLIRNFR